jgi:hypothetical protein
MCRFGRGFGTHHGDARASDRGETAVFELFVRKLPPSRNFMLAAEDDDEARELSDECGDGARA